MANISDSLKEFIIVAGLAAKIKGLEAELAVLKSIQSSLGVKTRGRKAGKASGKASGKRGKPGEVKEAVLAYLQKHKEGKAIAIAKDTGLKVGSINQTLFAFKKDGIVTQDKQRGSPFVLAKK